ncbi:MAG: beta-eliminating lyase-related protein, partial [Nitrospinota bacterium]
FIAKAQRIRKILGGGWRQAGILAAAGLYALDHNAGRLAEDHANAQRFAELTAGIPGVRHVFPTTPTNIVFLDVSESGRTAGEVNARLMERGAALSAFGESHLRAVTHLDVSRQEVEEAARALAEAVA